MTHAELLSTIREAYFALAGYRSPSLLPEQQEAELARCHDLLAAVVYGPEPDEDEREPTAAEIYGYTPSGDDIVVPQDQPVIPAWAADDQDMPF